MGSSPITVILQLNINSCVYRNKSDMVWSNKSLIIFITYYFIILDTGCDTSFNKPPALVLKYNCHMQILSKKPCGVRVTIHFKTPKIF